MGLLVMAGSLKAQGRKDLEQKRGQLDQQINTTNALLEQARKEKKSTQQEVLLLDEQVRNRQALVATLAAETRTVETRIEEDQAVVAALESDLTTLREDYARMVQFAYRNRSAYDRLSYLFAANSFAQAYRRSRYLDQLGEHRQQQARDIQDTQEALRQKVERLQAQLDEKASLLEQEKEQRDRLEHDRQGRQRSLDQLKKEEGRLRTTLNKQRKQRDDLDRAIRKAIEAEIKAQQRSGAASTGFTLTPEAKELSADFEKNKGKLPWPVERGVITGRYGKQAHPVLKGIMIENNGVDITTEKGSSVRSIFRGEVSSVIVIPGAGKAVVVSHGAYRSVYSNLREVLVTKGQRVETKQAIGVVMTEDNASTAHIEIWRIGGDGMNKVDPAEWIFR